MNIDKAELLEWLKSREMDCVETLNASEGTCSVAADIANEYRSIIRKIESWPGDDSHYMRGIVVGPDAE